MKNILVTGGAGYIGSHTLKPLEESGFAPISYDNLSNGHKAAVKTGELIVGDINDGDLLDSVFKEHSIDAVIHYAGNCSVEESITNPQKYFMDNLTGTLNLVKVMLSNKVNKIVFASTCMVYGDPISLPLKEDHPTNPKSPYGMSKLFAENALIEYGKQYNLSYAILRSFNVAGASTSEDIGEDHTPETHLIPLSLMTANGNNDRLVLFGDDYDTHDGSTIRDYIHVEDAAKAHIYSLQAVMDGGNRGYIFNIGCGCGYTTKEVITAVKDVTGKDVKYEVAGRRAGDIGRLVSSPERIHTELGWEPAHLHIGEIISTSWEWHKNNPNGYNDK